MDWTIGPLDHWTNRLLLGLFLDLSVFREGWEAEVVVLVNATDWWSFYWIMKIILSGFPTIFMSKFTGCCSGLFFCHENAKQTPQHLLADAIEAFLMISEKACIHWKILSLTNSVSSNFALTRSMFTGEAQWNNWPVVRVLTRLIEWSAI